MKEVSLYARVSSKKQAQERTVESQVDELERRISEDEDELLDEYKFIDNGYSGSSLERPGLDRLRDKAKEGKIDKIYIHSPDRLSRNYIYQMILLEEFQKAEVEIIFLNYKTDNSPESNLLLQMQGAIAEYERAKMIERSRRGKLHIARKGCIRVISSAPYGYRYIKKGTTGKESKLEINEEEARIVKQLFVWIGEERVSMRETVRRLKKMSIRTQKGKEVWNQSNIRRILRNPVYKGQAAYGKTKLCPVKPKLRLRRNAVSQQKYSRTRTDKKDWIYIPAPKIVEEALFDAVQEQLAENKQIAIMNKKKAQYLLQGLVICQCCKYAYCGKPNIKKKGRKVHRYYHYCCCSIIANFGRRICDNRRIRADVLEMNIWKKVKSVLNKSERLINEYQSRLSENKKAASNQDFERQENKLKQRISRLIDSYANEYINRKEFESKIKEMKQRLKEIEEEKEKVKDGKEAEEELAAIINSVKEFSDGMGSEIDQLDWLGKRSVIRALVERIEIDLNSITIIFRIKECIGQNRKNQNMQPIKIRQKIIRPKSREFGSTMCFEDE
ncbi:MAG: Transposon gamma-delta resolvase [Wolbachia endosymbiont of Ctenocephalides felis wCfeF]|nr:MAG: Transposon gamma-delta resolvase [Wolbachia endosymbiont of Ctenocephalides felis wCfeF]